MDSRAVTTGSWSSSAEKTNEADKRVRIVDCHARPASFPPSLGMNFCAADSVESVRHASLFRQHLFVLEQFVLERIEQRPPRRLDDVLADPHRTPDRIAVSPFDDDADARRRL